jgi:2,5-diamino-6-(ribosylamino)-4(3H)-pyrimidinone 5'-phosphate reductase
MLADQGTSLRPETTLFMLVSVDGKITSGDSDSLDPDQDWNRICGVKEGLSQYYDIEKTTDLFNLNTGRVMEKIGVNSRAQTPNKTDVTFFLIDSKPHLSEVGIRYFASLSKNLFIVTSNQRHPAFELESSLGNMKIIYFKRNIELGDLFTQMKQEHGINHLTIQSGSTLNADLMRQKLIDHLSIVIAPLLVGGAATPSLIGGASIHNQRELDKIKALKLVECKVLKDSYIHLKYDIIQDTEITNDSMK